MTPEEVLDRAADFIEERGWFQNAYQGATGCLCMLGAINMALTDGRSVMPPSINNDSRQRYNEVVRLARERIRQTRADVWTTRDHAPPASLWNDDPERTVDEVLAVLRGSGESDAAVTAPAD